MTTRNDIYKISAEMARLGNRLLDEIEALGQEEELDTADAIIETAQTYGELAAIFTALATGDCIDDRDLESVIEILARATEAAIDDRI